MNPSEESGKNREKKQEEQEQEEEKKENIKSYRGNTHYKEHILYASVCSLHFREFSIRWKLAAPFHLVLTKLA